MKNSTNLESQKPAEKAADTDLAHAFLDQNDLIDLVQK